VDPVSLIVGALAVGAGAGIRESASAAVRDAYQGLRDRLRRLWSRQSAAAAVLDQYQAEPAVFEAPLRHYLRQDQVAGDAEVLALARRLMESVDPSGAAAGKYVVDLRGARGVQVGDRNVQVNRFGGASASD
jgi:hypothetical protein